MNVVADAGPLIAFGKLGMVHLVARLYERVLVPPAVYREVVIEGIDRGATDAMHVGSAVRRGELVVVEGNVTVTDAVSVLPLQRGEQEAIQIAMDRSLGVLLDDRLAREEATRLGLPVRGTLGILVEAGRRGVMSRDELRLTLRTIASRDDIWISNSLLQRVLDGLE